MSVGVSGFSTGGHRVCQSTSTSKFFQFMETKKFPKIDRGAGAGG